MAVAPQLAKGALRIERVRVVAADPASMTLLDAKAALRRACRLRDGAQLQVDQLRTLVQRLERERSVLSTG